MVGQRSSIDLTRTLLGILALFFALQSILIFRLNLNWDEYFFLSHIHTFVADRPLEAIQTFHVQLLAWLAALPLNDPDQIVAGRLVMLLCEAGALFCLYRIARNFAPTEAAVIAVIAWCGAGFALAHGASFRTDPLSGFLIMASLALLFAHRLTFAKAIAAGALAAAALLVTIKAAIFLPCFLAALIWQCRERDARLAKLANFAAAAVTLGLAGAIFWWWHTSSLVPVPSADPATAAAPINATANAVERSSSILDAVILSQSVLPRWDYISHWLILSVFALIPVAVGLRTTITRIKPDPFQAAALLLLAMPVAVLLIYRNAFPYFFPFMMLPVAVLAAIGWQALERPLWRNVTLAGIAVVMIAQFIPAIQQGQSTQRAIAQVAAKMFPGGARYIDRNAMLPSFEKSGYFMSSWGVQGMVGSGHPELANIIDRDQPPLVIANTPILRAALDPAMEWRDLRLTGKEELAMRESYIPHWGDLWVAGKVLNGQSGASLVRIAGTYTLECEGSRTINGATTVCGKTVKLGKGRNRWSGGPLTLRWGEKLYRPDTPAPKEPIYYGF